MRATNGAVATTRGGMTPTTPVEVPTSACVAGMRAMSKMMNGRERPMLTTQPKTALSAGTGRRPPGAVRCKITPSTVPIT